MGNFQVWLTLGLLKMLTFCFCILAKVIPLCRDPRLSVFTDLILIMDLSNKSQSIIDFKKQTGWPDRQILFETDPVYQSKVSRKVSSRNICLMSRNPLTFLDGRDLRKNWGVLMCSDWKVIPSLSSSWCFLSAHLFLPSPP